ncbi:MAG: hypothetical protein U0797_25880 [Gemmataceae bacterium]
MTTTSRHGDDGLVIGRKTMTPIYDFVEGRAAPVLRLVRPDDAARAAQPTLERLLKKYASRTGIRRWRSITP